MSARPAVRLLMLTAALVGSYYPGARAQAQFVEVGGARGIAPYTMAAAFGGFGAGVAAADFDDDGDVDFFLPNEAGVPHQLYRNLGDGHFEEIAVAAGLASLDRGRVALWLDYDGDRRLDLFVASDCVPPVDATCVSDTLTLKLYRQIAPAQFVEVTLAAGFTDDVNDQTVIRTGLSAGDVNADGYLDLLTGLWGGSARLYLNQADGSFAHGGTGSRIGAGTTFHHQPVMHDFDGDGLLDVYHSVDFFANRLWINQGDETFVDAAAASGANNAWNDMGLSLGDYDNDGDLDVYITNIEENGRHNVLYRNDSVGEQLQFTDVAVAAGVDSGYFGWGTTFFDADNDGRLDIAATNGWDDDTPGGGPWFEDPSRFYRNQGGDPVTFADMSEASGFNDTLVGSALVALDYDRDGDLDLLQTCVGGGAQPSTLRLMENQLGGSAAFNNYLVIKPRMYGLNHRAIGAVVRARIGTLELTRLISAGTSYMGQEPAEAFFGLGPAASVDEVTIEWPDGTVSAQPGVAANRVVTLRNSLTLTLEGDALTWFQPEMGPAVTYDVVRGELATLRVTQGDFGQATTTCLADDQQPNSLTDVPDLQSGQGVWYLVRASRGSFEDPWGAQSGMRDSEIDGARLACP